MTTLIVTGGIATGKSTAIRLLMEKGGPRLRLFDCDADVYKRQSLVDDIRMESSANTSSEDEPSVYSVNAVRLTGFVRRSLDVYKRQPLD